MAHSTVEAQLNSVINIYNDLANKHNNQHQALHDIAWGVDLSAAELREIARKVLGA